ncbi:MAG: hypothetical protein LC804_26165 [Acidobacteria bacterium]|nr:hypothetical protein [Acidobacteriota bacterium]
MRWAALHQAAACMAENKGQLHTAFELYEAAGSHQAVSAFIVRQAPSMLAHGRSQSIEQWFSRVAEEAHSGWLLFWRGMCAIGWDHEAGCRFLEQAFSSFSGDDDRNGMIAAAGAMLAIAQGAGRITDMERHGRLLDQLLTNGTTDFESLPPVVVSAMLGYVAFRQYRRADAPVWVDRALRLCRESSNHALRGVIAVTALQYGMSIAAFNTAHAFVGEMRALWNDPHQSPIARVTAAMTLVLDAFHRADRGYTRMVEQALELASESGAFYAARYVVLGVGLFAALADGDIAVGSRWLASLRQDLARMGDGFRNCRPGPTARERQ